MTKNSKQSMDPRMTNDEAEERVRALGYEVRDGMGVLDNDKDANHPLVVAANFLRGEMLMACNHVAAAKTDEGERIFEDKVIASIFAAVAGHMFAIMAHADEMTDADAQAFFSRMASAMTTNAGSNYRLEMQNRASQAKAKAN